MNQPYTKELMPGIKKRLETTPFTAEDITAMDDDPEADFLTVTGA